ncbi:MULTISPECIES: HNH endonuclease [unclassified Caballeronia]|uniref:HNH endonuclease n=1 Tax=unclassified Caballeronia TaxID=2646786 RepID=UPI001F459973|nr:MULTISPECIES: HNH endonuclease [unclassified Caballeronia]MCE4542117.1 HNH endonuclease [Caballeronia sp. PC1]MCE4568837.1 HNH endonuclease [Caballeronia sp. CLC5]
MQILTIKDIESRCIQNESGCWLWSGYRNRHGYGCAKHEGRATELHRLVLTLAEGPPPTSEYQAAHGACHTRHCCNPAHLTWKTPSENQRDRARDGTDSRGERSTHAKLTAEQVRYIRSVYTPYSREYGPAALARKFGVSANAVSTAGRGLHWRHLTA